MNTAPTLRAIEILRIAADKPKIDFVDFTDLKPGDVWDISAGYRVQIGSIMTDGDGKGKDDWSFQYCVLARGEKFSIFAARHCNVKMLLELIGDGVKVENSDEIQKQQAAEARVAELEKALLPFRISDEFWEALVEKEQAKDSDTLYSWTVGQYRAVREVLA